MVNVGINLLGQVAKTAAFTAISNKVVDTLVTSKINKKNDHNKWLRETKLQLFTQISQEILSFDLDNSSADDERRLKEICAKTVMVIDDKKLIMNIQDFIDNLNNTQRALIFNSDKTELIKEFKVKSMDLVVALNNNLKRS